MQEIHFRIFINDAHGDNEACDVHDSVVCDGSEACGDRGSVVCGDSVVCGGHGSVVYGDGGECIVWQLWSFGRISSLEGEMKGYLIQ